MTPAADRAEAEPCGAFEALVLRLGLAGVEVGPDPADPERLRYRPAVLSPEQRDALRRSTPAVLALLRGEGVPSGETDAGYVLGERLGVADGLGMETHPGSAAWLIAVGESLRLCIVKR